MSLLNLKQVRLIIFVHILRRIGPRAKRKSSVRYADGMHKQLHVVN